MFESRKAKALVDEVKSLLDDPAKRAANDPGDMLAAVAGSGAQLRAPIADASRAGLDALAATGRPRVLLVAGMGGSAAAGDVLAAVAVGSDTPVLVHRGYGLPAWVSAEDLVVGISCSGTTEETLSAVRTAVERGIRLVTVGAPDSALANAGGAVHLAVESGGRQPRACLWSLAGSVLAAADALGVICMPSTVIAEAAQTLDQVVGRSGPEAALEANPAKLLALELASGLPMVWGFSEVAAAAAARFATQVAENAKLPAIAGALSEPQHNQVVAFDGPLGRGAPSNGRSDSTGFRIRPLVVRDSVEDPRLARRAAETVKLAADAGLTCRQLQAKGEHPLVRLASLIGGLDFISVYMALARGIDPTPVDPIVVLKQRLAVGAGG